MYSNLKINYFLIYIILFFYCNIKRPIKEEQLILQAENLMQVYPDSALILIQSIEYPEALNAKDYADYLLLQVQVHEKTGINIKDDTLMPISASYFSAARDSLKAITANLYTGKVYLAQGNNEEAMKYLLIAKDFAEQANNLNALGSIYYNIGNAYSGGGIYKKALDSFRKAQIYYAKSGNTKSEILIQDYIGNMVWQFGESDSALVYFQRVLNYATETNNEWYIGRMNRRLSSVYWDLKQFDKAKRHALVSMNLDKKRDDEIFNYSTIARCYVQEEKLDSALYYTEKIKETKNGNAAESLVLYHGLKAQIYERKGESVVATKEYKEIIRLLSEKVKEISRSPIPYIFEQHEKEYIEMKYNQLVIERLKLIILIGIIVFSGILSGVLLMYHVKRKENELLESERTLQTFKEMISKNELQVQDYNLVVSDQKKKSERLREFLTDRLEIARKVAQMNVVATSNTSEFMRQFQKVFGSNMLDWKNIYPLINELYDGFVDKIKAAHPHLSDKEIQLCCLIHADFRSDEQAVLLNYTQNSIRVKRTRLVKKMGFPNAEAFLSYLTKI